MPSSFDVIVVGGRPAGSTLAARLGRAGLRLLILERDPMPSLPKVSVPAIYSPTMKLLDEIDAEEADYARGTPPIRRWVTEFLDLPPSFNRVPDFHGRDYGYAVNRARFDDALWRHAASQPGVEARDRFTVTGLIWENGRVTGVRGRSSGKPEETFTADCILGADGRFSLVAREAGAAVRNARTDLPTSILYAYWEGAEPYDDGDPTIHMLGSGYGIGFLLMDSADGRLGVVVEGQAALLEAGPGNIEGLYLNLLQSQPRLWRRMARAGRVTEVRGMRRVGNLYRTPGGPGWALTGDALHQKDPLDGQGLFDAVFTARELSRAVLDWKRGVKSWEAALASYDAAVRAETFPMYLETMNRVKRDLFTRYPGWMLRSVFPRLMNDPEYKRRFGLLIVRGVSPRDWLPRRAVWRALALGAVDEARHQLTSGRSPERTRSAPRSTSHG